MLVARRSPPYCRLRCSLMPSPPQPPTALPASGPRSLQRRNRFIDDRLLIDHDLVVALRHLAQPKHPHTSDGREAPLESPPASQASAVAITEDPISLNNRSLIKNGSSRIEPHRHSHAKLLREASLRKRNRGSAIRKISRRSQQPLLSKRSKRLVQRSLLLQIQHRRSAPQLIHHTLRILGRAKLPLRIHVRAP